MGEGDGSAHGADLGEEGKTAAGQSIEQVARFLTEDWHCGRSTVAMRRAVAQVNRAVPSAPIWLATASSLREVGRLPRLPAPVEDGRGRRPGNGQRSPEVAQVAACQLPPDLGGLPKLPAPGPPSRSAAGRRARRTQLDPVSSLRPCAARVPIDAHDLRAAGDRLIISFEVVHANGQGAQGHREPDAYLEDRRRPRAVRRWPPPARWPGPRVASRPPGHGEDTHDPLTRVKTSGFIRAR